MTKRVARAADDGYRNPLVPGLRATADAERLATALAWADARLEFPGPHPAVAEEPVQDEAFWLAFLLALVPPGAHELHEAIVASRPSWSSAEAPEIPGADPRTIPAYRAWAERAGSQAEAFLGEPAWSPERRFGRAFERLALPGLNRTARYELLLTLGAAGTADSPPTRCTSARSTTPPSWPPSACSSPATRCCSSAAPPTSRRPPASASARSTARSRCGARGSPPPASRPRRSAPRSAL